MSTREALIEEILKQPEPILLEVQNYLKSLLEMQKHGTNGAAIATSETWPAGYFYETAGAFAEEPFDRPPQLPGEKREEW
jgi:hypothetical protein